jgi:hypothetical protein
MAAHATARIRDHHRNFLALHFDAGCQLGLRG